MYINIKSDYIIVDMKKNKGPGYHIPDKFLYKYLSAPNYFGEIIEWIGWAIFNLEHFWCCFLDLGNCKSFSKDEYPIIDGIKVNLKITLKLEKQ